MEKTKTLNDLRKSYTSMMKNPEFKKAEVNRTKTVHPSLNKDKLNLLTENIYSKIKINFSGVMDTNVPKDYENVILDNGGLKVKAYTVRKMSAIFKTNSKEEDSGMLIDKSTQNVKENYSKIKEVHQDETENENVILKKKNQEIFGKIPSESLHIFETLMYEYYNDISENTLENYDNYVVNNLTIMSFLETIIPKDLKSIKLTSEEVDKIREFDRTKKTLFLDLDETLIHSDTLGNYEMHDECVKMELDGSECEFGILIRPYCNEFLEFAAKNFNVVLFTAGHKFYAEAILKKIDPSNKYFHLKLFRQHCIEFKNIFIKDLTILPTFGLKDLVIVDNCIFSFARNLTNGVLISSYYNDLDDLELLNLIGFLENNIIDGKDSRTTIEEIFKFNSTKSFLWEQLNIEGVTK